MRREIVTQREQFKAAMLRLAEQPESSFEKPYGNDDLNAHWAVWQASRRAALEECWEAVHGERLEDPTETHGDMAYERAVTDCENAIRAIAASSDGGKDE
jgi:hypothetical protein